MPLGSWLKLRQQPTCPPVAAATNLQFERYMTGATRRCCSCRAGLWVCLSVQACRCGIALAPHQPAAVDAHCASMTSLRTTFFFLALLAGIIIAIMFACECFILNHVPVQDAWGLWQCS